MKLALIKNGPLSVSFEVHPDFMHYKSGVYHRVSLERELDPPPYFEVSSFPGYPAARLTDRQHRPRPAAGLPTGQALWP